MENTKTKREAVDENDDGEEEATEEDTEEKCRVDMWRCLSKVDISLIAAGQYLTQIPILKIICMIENSLYR